MINSLLSSAVSTIKQILQRLSSRPPSVRCSVFVLVGSLDARARPDGLRSHARVVTSTDRLGDLGRVASSLQVLLPHSLLDPVNLVLVPLPVPHGSLLGLL